MAVPCVIGALVTVMSAHVPHRDASVIRVDCNDRSGRAYDGIGGLSNSCAPWLRSYSPSVQSDILDILFKPDVAGSLQVLKIEIGGDGHSTINTEATHWPRGPPTTPDFTRGWELWFAAEAKKRNPHIRIVALPWSFPYWFPQAGLGDAAGVAYYVEFVKGAKQFYNVTVDYIGIQNEAGVPSPNDVIALRRGLDAAGLQHTLIVTPDTHDFTIASQLENHSSELFAAIGVVGIHEPLRTTKTLPPAFAESGKPIWSSESYTTFSDSNGGGCWARALSWGFVYGNVTAHIAWNILQSYPSVGSGMNYDGHGLMWAESPWSGHYTINSPIWVSAQYTQFTRPGWMYLPVGKGSGELPGGGTCFVFVSLVDPETGNFTIIIQTTEYNMSKCFKDSHDPFTVASSQSVTFQTIGLVERGVKALQLRRTVLVATSPIDPIAPYNDTNTYFERLDNVLLSGDGSFSLDLPVNSVTTVTTLVAAGGRAVPPHVPAAVPFPRRYNDSLQGYPIGTGARYLIDQQGVFESRPSRTNPAMMTLQQTTPAEPQEWHGWGKLPIPQTFVGPASSEVNISAEVLPPIVANGFAAIGFTGQLGHDNIQRPNSPLLSVIANGEWSILGESGTARPDNDGWFHLELRVAPSGDYHALVGGIAVASGSLGLPVGWFPTLVASYTGVNSSYSNAEFRNLALELVPLPTTPPPPSPVPPSPPPGPTPPPPPLGAGLSLVPCSTNDPRQLWIFSGEDAGEPGTLRSSSNLSSCLDSQGALRPAQLIECTTPRENDVEFTWNSASGTFSGVETRACQVRAHGSTCHYCLDAERQARGNAVGIFDCKAGDSNQIWTFDASAGGAPIRWKENAKLCIGVY